LRPKLKLAVFGASGRMGSAVLRLAKESGDIELIAAIDVSSEASSLAGAEVVIDFSAPAAVPALARAAVSAGTAIVSGTTGLDAAATKALDDAAAHVPVLWEPNMSVGVFVLGELLRDAIRILGPGFDVEIVETHHSKKADAPSGTAMRLAEIARASRPGKSQLVTGREGKPGARKSEEIGVLAVRGGDVIGDHVVHLLGEGERIELVHRASNRDLFASGALRAARWACGKNPGRYGLADVLRT